MRTVRLRPLLLATLLAGLAFVAGFAAGRGRLFRLPSGAHRESAPRAVETVMETGWWNPVRQPNEAARLAELEKLGYAQTYEAAGESEYGVVVHDARRSQPGYNLIVSAHAPSALLTDMEGRTLHEWSHDFAEVPTPAGWEPSGTFGMRYFRRAHLLEEGHLLAVYDRTALVRLDEGSNLAWGLVGGYHHDLDVTRDGTIWVLEHEVHEVPRFREDEPIFEDFVTRVSPDGRVLGRVSLLEAFERSPYAALLAHAGPGQDIFHTNTVEIFEGELEHLSPLFAAGNALISVWGLDTVAIVDLERVEVVWALTGLWRRQHEPAIVENGNLLVFDNQGPDGWSRVLELDPFTQQIVWAYEGDPANDFKSELCGAVQRLANGNTLVTESLSGRAFELTPEKEVVWRWVSPYRAGPEGEGVAVLMDVVRLDPDLPLEWTRRAPR